MKSPSGVKSEGVLILLTVFRSRGSIYKESRVFRFRDRLEYTRMIKGSPSRKSLSLRDLCSRARKAGACSVVDEILTRYTSVQDLIDRNPEDAAEWAVWYAGNVIKGRWPEVEPLIMTSPKQAAEYAFIAIGGRWSDAESVIMTDPWVAYWYARYVIGGRWLEAEPAIMLDFIAASWYAGEVIQGDWPGTGIVSRRTAP